MSKFMEEIRAEGREEGRAEVWEEAQALIAQEKAVAAEAKAEAAEAKAKAEAKTNAIKNVLSMLQDGLSVDKISKYSGLPIDEVQEFAALTAH